MIKLLNILLLLLIVSCASTRKFPEENSPDVKVFKTVCGQCHNPSPHPKEHISKDWDKTVDVMVIHMENRGMAYNQDEIQTIRDYLKRNAS